MWTGFPGPEIAFAPQGAHRPSLHWRFALSGPRLRQWEDEGLWPRAPLPIHNRAPIAAAADHILSLMTGDDALATRLRANAVEGLLLELWRQQRAVAEPTWILEIKNHLQARWQQAPDYVAIAARFHMPLPRLRREFRRCCGEPIHLWFLRQRIEAAKALLLADTADLDAIATQCGYADRTFFSRQFSRLAGISPAAYRRSAYG